MKRKLTRLSISIFALGLTTTVLLAPSPRVTKAQSTDCAVVAQVCRDISDMMYDMCIVGGGDPSACTWMAARKTISCIRENGCEPVNY